MSYLTAILSETVTLVSEQPISEVTTSTVNNGSYVSTLANMIGGLIVVIALIFVLAYIVKRLNLVPSQHGQIKTIAVSAVGQKEKLLIVEINQQQYLLGVTSQQINLIDKLHDPVTPNDTAFAKRLQQAKESHDE
ncbi:flagellar biosynthetic protein FliO [Shewanella aestuarii]|uniref:flagellar biosynthetic protein FliO n=1 Tax=Shewanella aestuarii TaxID=1028752 RepID=UPI001FCAC452|nr:flagellar biosynthetic protein FliO [Shewanella aestuarii]